MSIRRENYINIQGWMITDLMLKGNDLLIYAIIYGFTQDGEQWFDGSRQYLADWCNSTKRGISKNLESLVSLEYIIKDEYVVNNVKFCKYKANLEKLTPVNKVPHPGEQSSPPPGEQSSPNNIYINNLDNNNKEKSIKEKKETFKETEEQLVLEKIKSMTDKEMSEKILAVFKNKKIKGNPITKESLNVFLHKLQRLSKGNKTVMLEMLDVSIVRGYTDVFELNKSYFKNHPPLSPASYDLEKYESDTSNNYDDYINSFMDKL